MKNNKKHKHKNARRQQKIEEQILREEKEKLEEGLTPKDQEQNQSIYDEILDKNLESEETEDRKEFLDDNVKKIMFHSALPAIVAGFAGSVYNLVGAMFLGNFGDPEALAALSINSVFDILFGALSAMVGMGASILIPNALGTKDFNKMESIITATAWASFGVSMILSSVFLIFLEPILIVIGAVPAVLPDAKLYAQITLGFSFLVPFNGLMDAVLRVKGGYGHVYVALGTMALNICLNALLVVGLKMSVAGAAISMVASHAFMMSISAVTAYRTHGAIPIRMKHLKNVRANLIMLWEIVELGFPSANKTLLLAISTVFVNRALADYGVEAIAGYAIAIRVMDVMVSPVQSGNMAVQSILSFNYGAGRMDRVYKVMWGGFAMMGILGALESLIFVALPEQVFRVFTANKSVMGVAKESLMISCSAFIMYAWYMLNSGYVQSMGHSRLAAGLSFVRPAINIALYHILPKYWGMKGIWAVLPFTDIAASIVAMIAAQVIHIRIKKRAELKADGEPILNINDEMIDLVNFRRELLHLDKYDKINKEKAERQKIKNITNKKNKI